LQAELLSLDLIQYFRDNALGCIAQFCRCAYGVGNDYPKKQGSVSLHVLGERIHYPDNIRGHGALGLLCASSNLALID
jgi:hypothetical protein